MIADAVARQPRVISIPNNGQQPGTHVSSTEAIEEPESAQISFLNYVFGVVVIACKPTRKVVSGAELRQHDRLESIEFLLVVHDLVLRDFEVPTSYKTGSLAALFPTCSKNRYGNIRAEQPVLGGEDAVRVSGGNDE